MIVFDWDGDGKKDVPDVISYAKFNISDIAGKGEYLNHTKKLQYHDSVNGNFA